MNAQTLHGFDHSIRRLGALIEDTIPNAFGPRELLAEINAHARPGRETLPESRADDMWAIHETMQGVAAKLSAASDAHQRNEATYRVNRDRENARMDAHRDADLIRLGYITTPHTEEDQHHGVR